MNKTNERRTDKTKRDREKNNFSFRLLFTRTLNHVSLDVSVAYHLLGIFAHTALPSHSLAHSTQILNYSYFWQCVNSWFCFIITKTRKIDALPCAFYKYISRKCVRVFVWAPEKIMTTRGKIMANSMSERRKKRSARDRKLAANKNGNKFAFVRT